MNTEALFLFLILLLGLVLCCFLGGQYKEGYNNQSYDNNKNNMSNNTSNNNNNNNTNQSSTSNSNQSSSNSKPSSQYDNYNHYSGTSTPLTSGQVFNGPNGGTITVITNSDGSQSLQITTASGETPVVYTSEQPSSTKTEGYTTYNGANASATTFYGPNGETATVVTGDNGQQAIRLDSNNGTVTYTLSTANPNGYYNPPGYNPPGSVGAYNPPGYNPPGTSSSTYNPPGYNPPGTVGAYNPPGYNPPGTVGAYNPPGYNPPGTVGAYNPPGYNPPGNSVTNPWMSALPPGIPFSQIPPGDENLYILKTEIVPPVCPACNVNASQNISQCPPCPAPARCKLPPFECKKVPNYSALDDEYQPVPVLNDFSTFGM